MDNQQVLDFLTLEGKQSFLEIQQKYFAKEISKGEFELQIEILLQNSLFFDQNIAEDKILEQLNEENTTVIIANGDITTLNQGQELHSNLGIDGIMIGREVFNNPFVFNPDYKVDEKGILNTTTGKYFDREQRLELLLYHIDLWDQTWGPNKNYNVLKKYYKIYIQGFDGAKELRVKLMETTSVAEAKNLFMKWL